MSGDVLESVLECACAQRGWRYCCALGFAFLSFLEISIKTTRKWVDSLHAQLMQLSLRKAVALDQVRRREGCLRHAIARQVASKQRTESRCVQPTGRVHMKRWSGG